MTETEEAGRGPPLPMARPLASDPPGERDWASGWTLLALWGAPVGLLLVVTLLGQFLNLSPVEFGSLLTFGTAWLGLSCLANAVRCGRVHCWMIGIALPALAVVGALDLLRPQPVPWSTYITVLWSVVGLSFLLEWVTGPYFSLRPRATAR